MLIVIDNYDSFTYNLVQYLGELGADPVVFRNDVKTVAEIQALSPTHIVISPGPGRPGDAGISEALIKACYQQIPILGVCLGHQAIGEVFGTNVIHAPYLMHGKTSEIYHDGKSLFSTIPDPFTATRYHSLVLDKATLSTELEITAWTDDDIIMGVRHKRFPLEGIQFHPESILTVHGKDILRNFLKFR